MQEPATGLNKYKVQEEELIKRMSEAQNNAKSTELLPAMIDPEQINFGEGDENNAGLGDEIAEDLDMANLDDKFGSRNPRTSMTVNNNPALRDSNSNSPDPRFEVSTGLAKRNMALDDNHR